MTTVYYTYNRNDLFENSEGFNVEATAASYDFKCRNALWSLDGVDGVETTDLGDGFDHRGERRGIVVDDGEIKELAERALEEVYAACDFYVTIRYEVWECGENQVVQPDGARRPERLTRHGRAATALEALVLADSLDPENGDIDFGHRALVWDEDEGRFLTWEETEALRGSAEYPDAEFFERATA
jgi:hypothetical protein